MDNSLKFFKCKHCGNIVVLPFNSGAPVSCCGEKMELLQPNTTEAATEKHLPVATVNANKLTVDVGSITHPMSAEHYISFIAVEYSDGSYAIKPLAPTDTPCAEFCFASVSPVKVYEYCNLHGLWSVEL